TLTIIESPAAPVSGGDQVECVADPIQTLTATATAPSGQTVVWYDQATGGSIVTPIWNSLGSKTYYAQANVDNGGCESLTRTPVELTLLEAPLVDTMADVTICDSYTLPGLTNGNYYTAPGGTGTLLNEGDKITSSQTIYIYAETGTTPKCTAESSFIVTTNATPIVDAPDDVAACDSYILPALTQGAYFAKTGGQDPIPVGTVISATQTIYVYAETGTNPNCFGENIFVVTINATPLVDAPA